jgi:mannose-6-phosphate isomerase-like protein (cupin superfamily)
MLIKDVQKIAGLTAGDGSFLREILHPDRDPVAVRHSLAQATVRPGKATLPHRLTSTEVYYIVSGVGTMHIDDESRSVHEGHAIVIPPCGVQWIANTGAIALVFLCIVDPAWREEDDEVVRG